MVYKRLIVVFLFLIFILPCVFAKDYPYRVFLEAPMVMVDQSWAPGSFKISPNGVRYAYVVLGEKGEKVILDGKEHRSFKQIVNLWFSPDSSHLAYIAKEENKYFLVFDGIEGKGYDLINVSSFSFSNDSKHYVFAGKIGDKWVVATETGEGKTYDEINDGLLRFSSDSLNLAYPARIGDKWVPVVNGNEGKVCDGIRAFLFSSDGKRTAAVVRVENDYVVSVDGEEGPAFPMVKPDSLVFSPDSQSIGYIAADQGMEFIVINHQVGKAYDRIVSQGISFSPDSSKIAFAAQLQEGQFMVVDGVEGKTYAALMEEPPVFSPDGNKTAYTAYTGTDWTVVLDGVEQTGYAGIGKGSLLFNNRGSRLAYTAKMDNGSWTVVVDGIAGRYYDAIGQNSLAFSPDGTNVVYSAKQGKKWLVVLDNKESRLFDGIIAGGDNQIRFRDSVFFDYCVLDGQNIVTVQERIADKSDFKDFQEPMVAEPETQTPKVPMKEFQFQFNPSDGACFIETAKLIDKVETEIMKQTIREEEIKVRTDVHRDSLGYQVDRLYLKYQVNDIEEPAEGEALSALEGVKYSLLLNSSGSITGFKGLEDFDTKLRKIPKKYYRKYKEPFAKETLELSLKDSWKDSIESFVGKSIRLGEVWETSAKIPLPNGETSEVTAKIKFKEETAVGSVACILIQVDYDLNSPNLTKLVRDLIKEGAPQLQTEPEVEISASKESIVDPNTLLSYSSRMEMVMKAIVDMPNLGRKEFTFKRNLNIDYEYLNSNQSQNNPEVKK